ncbi:hypothetical protein TVNIR_2224 [Thioalkalivibrio nitratireducens DSM 14787]|uniref:Uncharacterized protein n=1 Tax=Thioalkalivibrio nitratireducens (strain DSM 14787 / UNIQEM 213 / ALEN2) TaxID=1255043 RepID=L0DY60_THIND|nr:hypothetical protein [Thioalkalivibrio nitratireducens]AGA33880.1 hypothetical protein TVNIR_2224 [Thioalkalivibrio nitratireducens DSM 14787]
MSTAGPALADEIQEQIELGLDLYQEQDYGAAITELEFAINDIRKLMANRIADTFPDAPAGWTAALVESQSGGGGMAGMFGGGGTMLQRAYTQDDGSGQLEASLIVDSPMIQGVAAIFNNPAMMAAQPNTERVRIGRESAMLKWEPNRAQAEATLLLDGRIMMQVKGRNLESSDVAVELLRNWDLRAVREQTAR